MEERQRKRETKEQRKYRQGKDKLREALGTKRFGGFCVKKTELGEQDRNKGTEERQTGKGQVEESPQKERNQEGFAKKKEEN